jgi:exopolysaccharide production protein ExoQ
MMRAAGDTMISSVLQRDLRGAMLPALAVGLALVLGGGGSPAPMPEMVLQLTLAAIFAAWLWSLDEVAKRSVPRSARILFVLVMILPLIQLIPLPPALWHNMPGRELEREALGLIGAENSWQSWSLAPARTLASLLTIIPVAAIILMTAAAQPQARRQVVLVVLAVAVFSMVIGAGQLSGGPGGVMRFYAPASPFLDGFQANHNSAADLLLIGMIAAAALIRGRIERTGVPRRPHLVLVLAAGATLLLGLGVVLTASRFGIALLPVALLAEAILLWPLLRFQIKLKPRVILAVGAGLAALLLLGALALRQNTVLAGIVGRFDFTGELRPELWWDSIYAIRQYFPFGSGMGNFVSSLLPAERLEVVRETMPNRAHDDFIELAVEGGIFGLALLGVIVMILLRAALGSLRSPAAEDRGLCVFALASLVVLALHSLVDYPFRSMALASIAAACAGLILASRHRVRTGQSGDMEEQA